LVLPLFAFPKSSFQLTLLLVPASLAKMGCQKKIIFRARGERIDIYCWWLHREKKFCNVCL